MQNATAARAEPTLGQAKASAWTRVRAAFGIRNQRLISGLVLGLFLLLHFGTIALGLISAEAMDAAQPFTMAPWRSPPGTVLLFGALLVHFGLSLRALYLRRTLRMTYREGAQLALGLAIPFLLASHLAVTRIVPIFAGEGPNFTMEVRTFWIKAPAKGVQQSVLLVVAWLHACLGLWFWLPGPCAGARAPRLTCSRPRSSFRFWRSWAWPRPASSSRRCRRPPRHPRCLPSGRTRRP